MVCILCWMHTMFLTILYEASAAFLKLQSRLARAGRISPYINIEENIVYPSTLNKQFLWNIIFLSRFDAHS